jgi:branched-chain amino acid aminotransferase
MKKMGNGIAIWRLVNDEPGSIERVERTPAPVSLDDGSRLLPGGGYTTFRTFGRYRVLPLEDHFNRLEETASLSGRPVCLDRERIRRALHQALAEYPAQEMRVRLTLDLEQEPGTIYFLVERLQTPTSQDYERGVRVVTRSLHRDNPKAKRTDFIATADAIRHALPEGINEAVMIGKDGRVLEGLSSNFFAVKDGEIWTAEEGVLSGITRAQVLEVIRALKIPLQLVGPRMEELADIDEAFLTSASRAVLPVTEIDGHMVGHGQPGALTQQIMKGYWEQVEAALETV